MIVKHHGYYIEVKDADYLGYYAEIRNGFGQTEFEGCFELTQKNVVKLAKEEIDRPHLELWKYRGKESAR